MSVPFQLDRYGNEARFSHFADLLELEALQAMCRHSISKFDLADFIQDSGFVVSLKSLWSIPEDDSSIQVEESDLNLTEAMPQAERVFSLINERSIILGERYPFVIENTCVRLKSESPESVHFPYLQLLDLTLSHAYSSESFDGCNPRDKFEEVCLEAFRVLGYQVAGLMRQEGATNFQQRLAAAANQLKTVSLASDVVITRARQQDAGVDLLAIHDFPADTRAGRHMWIGQATCGKSDSWDRKRSEPKPKKWGLMTRNALHPARALMVPQHADPDHLKALAEGEDFPVFDRLRLCCQATEDVREEKLIAVIRGFLRFEIESWSESQSDRARL